MNPSKDCAVILRRLANLQHMRHYLTYFLISTFTAPTLHSRKNTLNISTERILCCYVAFPLSAKLTVFFFPPSPLCVAPRNVISLYSRKALPAAVAAGRAIFSLRCTYSSARQPTATAEHPLLSHTYTLFKCFLCCPRNRG